MNDRPKIGVGVIVIKEGQLLLGKRKNAHGEGTWSPPGGHLEFGESLQDCAKRELLEETGLTALSIQEGPWTNEVIEGKHYVTLFAFVDHIQGELQTREPTKCEGWQWFDWKDLPQPLFPSICSLIRKMGLDRLKHLSLSHTPFWTIDTLQSLIDKIFAFHEERNWDQFHSPKNLAMALASEIGELIDPFRWLTEQESHDLDTKMLEQVRDEIGDIFKLLIHLSDKLGIDPIEATFDKIEKLKKKYPADQCFGKSLKYSAYH